MVRKASPISGLVMSAFLILGSRTVASGQERSPSQGLIPAATAVVAVEILSADYTATSADGPMVATAKVLKGLKGRLTSGREFRFSETAWVGPTYQKGDYRILFLERAGSSEYPRPTEWRILSRLDARTDFFIEKDSLPDLSLESLNAFLKRIRESEDGRRQAVFGKGMRK